MVRDSLLIKNMEVGGGAGMNARLVALPQKVGSAALYMNIIMLEDLRDVCKTMEVALANPYIPTFCGYIGIDKKGKKRAQGREIQLVGMDKRKGWVLLLVLLWENEEDKLVLPDPEDVRK